MTIQSNIAKPLASVVGLGVSFPGARTPASAGIDFALAPGEILGLVGESGSGKSVTCRALIGLLPPQASVTGQMTFDGHAYDLAQNGALAPLRGADIAMIFQDPMSALDPLMSVRRHLRLRGVSDPLPALAEAGLGNGAEIADRFPHQLSGGQAQRVAIACALARAPKLLIADEPTTALDVTVQAGILRHLKDLATRRGMAVILVTHDLAVVYRTCARVLVMSDGHVVEQGPVADVLEAPREAYTRALLRAIPRPALRGQRLGDTDARSEPFPAPSIAVGKTPVLAFENITVAYALPGGRRKEAVTGVSLSLLQGEVVGLVGESGSGKSSLAKTAVGLARPERGTVRLDGTALDWRRPEQRWRREVQYIFQDPRGALDPTARIHAQVRAPLDIHEIGAASERADAAHRVLSDTGMAAELHRRKPGALSGGQRQRATIARALTLTPRVLICDESVSALDVSIQARILDLLMDLRARHGLAILFISHDLGVVRHIADRVAVMQAGQLVEEGATEALFAAPRAAYTERLLAAVPTLPRGVA